MLYPVSQQEPTAFDRIFSRRDYLRGDALRAALWSLASALMLFALLVTLFLLAELFEHRGRLHVLARDVDAVEQLMTGRKPGDIDVIRGAPPPVGYRLTNQGLLPTVWHSRHRIYGPVVEAAYRRLPALRVNVPAFAVLLLTALGLALFRAVALSRAAALSNRVGMDAATRLRTNIHRQRLRLGTGDLDGRTDNGILNLFAGYVDKIRVAIALTVRRIVRCPAEMVLLFCFGLVLHWRLAIQVSIPLAVCWWLVRRESARLDEDIDDARNNANRDLAHLSENLNKARLVRGYGMDEFEQKQFEKRLKRYRDSSNSIDRRGSRQKWMSRLLFTLCLTLLLWFTGAKTLIPVDDPRALTLSAAIGLLAAFGFMFRPLEDLLDAFQKRRQAVATSERVYEYLARIPDVGQAVGARFCNR